MKIKISLAGAKRRKLSALQQGYQEFFQDKLKMHGEKRVNKMDTEKKKTFFGDIKKTWPKARKALQK